MNKSFNVELVQDEVEEEQGKRKNRKKRKNNEDKMEEISKFFRAKLLHNVCCLSVTR